MVGWHEFEQALGVGDGQGSLECCSPWDRKEQWLPTQVGFPDSSVGKESTYNAGDPSLIPGSGRSPGGGKDYPLQYSWASFVAHLIKNPPAVQETCVRSLGWEDPLKKGKAIHSSIQA